MKNIIILLLTSLVSVLALNFSVYGQRLNENFEYGGTSDTSIVTITPNWVRHSGAMGPAYSSTSLSYASYASSGSGGAITFRRGGSGVNDGDVNRVFSTAYITNNSIYVSFLVKIDSAFTEDYFFHLGPNPISTNFRGRVYARSNSTGWSLSLSKSSETNVDDNTVLTFGQTYLVVLKYTYSTGTTSDDFVTLYLYSSGIPSTEPGSPLLTIGPVGSGTGSDPSNIGSIAVRQGSNTPGGTIDGIRVDSLWSNIFPAAGSSAIVVSPTSLSGLTYLVGAGPSTSQSYNLSGSNLTPISGDLTVTGTTNYEVSLDNSTFSGSVNKSYTGGALSATPIYVRLKSGLAGGEYNAEVITNSGGGAATQNVTVNGAVIKAEPTNHVSSFTGVPGNPGYYYTNLSWTDASGGTVPEGYLIKRSDVDFASIVTPVDGVPESNTFSIQNVAQAVQSSIFTGFAGTTYYFKIYPYTNSGSYIDYKTDGSVPQFSLTSSSAPSLPLTENFNYTTGSNLTVNGYVAHSGAGSLPIQVAASPLTFSGYINSGLGKSVNLTAPVTASAEDVNKLFSSVTSNSIYASFMVNVTSADTGVYFFHFGPENSTTDFLGKVFVKGNSTNIAFGVAKRNNTDAVYTPFSYSLNTTYLVVVKYSFNSGTTSDDEVKLWVNPVLNGTEPVSDLTQTDTGTDALKLDFFAFRQASYGPALTLGGLRISTSWVPQQSTNFSSSFTLQNSWNLISFPGIHPNSMHKDTLYRFRDNTANVYYFNGSYITENVLVSGKGYWLKHSGAKLYNWNGTVQSGILYPKLNYATVDPVNGNSGWNLIGVFDYEVAVSQLTTSPPGLKTGLVYGFTPGASYNVASNLQPGQAYWINLSSAGQIILPPRATAKEVAAVQNYLDEKWGKIMITDNSAREYTLYISGNKEEDLNIFSLPPLPPQGVFDVRFTTGKFVEHLFESKTIGISSADYPIKIKVEALDIELSDISGKGFNAILKSGQEVVLNNSALNILSVTANSEIATLPSEYLLEQNYPNPFNPTTKIRYSIPMNAMVTLKAYNAMGQEVATLVNQQQSAGRYELEFNSTGLASGIYFYKITANEFSETKKMILLK